MEASKYPLFGMLIVATFAVGFLFGRFSLQDEVVSIDKKSPTMNTTSQTNRDNSTATPRTTGSSTILEAMTDEQKKTLKALGIDASEITPTMIVCAETSLGADRVKEIKNGSSLSFSEKAKLAMCYK